MIQYDMFQSAGLITLALHGAAAPDSASFVGTVELEQEEAAQFDQVSLPYRRAVERLYTILHLQTNTDEEIPPLF